MEQALHTTDSYTLPTLADVQSFPTFLPTFPPQPMRRYNLNTYKFSGLANYAATVDVSATADGNVQVGGGAGRGAAARGGARQRAAGADSKHTRAITRGKMPEAAGGGVGPAGTRQSAWLCHGLPSCGGQAGVTSRKQLFYSAVPCALPRPSHSTTA